MPSTLVSRKRAKPATADWKIVFEDASALKTVVDAASTLGKRASFNVVETREGDHFLTVDAADPGYICVLKARLRIATPTFKNAASDTSFSFCIECTHVTCAIDNSSCAHLVTTMEGYTETAKIVLKMYDPETHAHEVVTELPTYIEEEPVRIDDIEFKMNLELDAQVMRELIKKSHKAHAEHMEFTVDNHTKGAKKLSVVQLCIDGTFRQEQTFCCETLTDPDGSLMVRAVASEGTHKLNEADLDAAGGDDASFEGVYPIDKIEAFLKNLPCRMITVRVQTGQPLFFVHRIGCDDVSYIHYLVAATNTDD